MSRTRDGRAIFIAQHHYQIISFILIDIVEELSSLVVVGLQRSIHQIEAKGLKYKTVYWCGVLD